MASTRLTSEYAPAQLLCSYGKCVLVLLETWYNLFGCGSTSEHAPWALIDFGIKCVISSSFADIFYNNCFNNGILPIIINEKSIKELSDYSKRKEEIEVDLTGQSIFYGNQKLKFDIEPAKKKRLLEGLDNIGLSLKKIPNIEKFENSMNKTKPWI